MKILELFKPVTASSEVTDAGEVKSLYQYWRWRIFVGMYVGYVFYYFTRKSYTCIMPLLMRDLHLTKSDLGALGSILALTYGLSKFLSGVLADRSNPRVFMSIGLICTGVLNILFGASSSILWFAIFWGLNGWFQGWGWPPCAKLLTHWYSQKERGTWWGMWNSSHNVGGAIIPIVVGVSAQLLGWRFGMYIPGLMCIAVGVFIFYTLRDTPQSLGLPPIEKFKNDATAPVKVGEENLSMKEMLFKYVLNNYYIWVLAIAYFFVYVIRGAVNDWSALFLMETRGYSLVTANASIVWFEVGGLIGSLVAGWASDKIFSGRRGPINVLFSLGVIGALAGLWFMPVGYLVFDYALIFIIGFLIFGPQMLIGIAAAELSHKKAAGSATGFIGWVAYLGQAAAGYPLSKATEWWGWEGCFLVLVLCGIMTVLLLSPLWSIKTNPKYMNSGGEAEAA
jgi:OPA family sugar phosphate sensor protein UhpC-like MFS transporter